MKLKVVNVSPDLAEQWLRENSVNRKLRKKKVSAYASDMTAGNWLESESMIVFDESGKLLNGQHRLNAVIQSGINVRFAIAEGVDAASMAVMDSGASRTTRDMFHLRGYKNANALSSIAKLSYEYFNDRLSSLKSAEGSRAPTRSELDSFIAQHEDIHESVELVLPFIRGKNRLDPLPVVVGAAHWVISQKNSPKLATMYFEQISSPTDEPSDSAIHAVNSRFRTIRNGERAAASAQLLILLRGWQLYAVDDRIKSIRITPASKMIPLSDIKEWDRPLPWE